MGKHVHLYRSDAVSLPGASPHNLRPFGEGVREGFREYTDATDVQVAEAALAGWKVEHRPGSAVYPWAAQTPNNKHVSIFITEREAWAAAWHCMQAALTERGRTY